MLVRPLTHLIRREDEPLAILSPERKVEHPVEVPDQYLIEGKVERQQTIQLPGEVEEHSSEGVGEVAACDASIER
jgi:hypothetical protein